MINKERLKIEHQYIMKYKPKYNQIADKGQKRTKKGITMISDTIPLGDRFMSFFGASLRLILMSFYIFQ